MPQLYPVDEIVTEPDANHNETAKGFPQQQGLAAVLSRDLFFGMRIRTSLRKLGYVVSIAQDAATFTNHLSQGDQRASLGFVDFNSPVDWSGLRAAIASGVPIIAFGAHTDVDGFRAAKAAGVTRVVSNGEFSRSLPALARKYGRSTP